MGKKISCFNKAVVRGYVQGFKIKTFDSGAKLANIRIKDKSTDNDTYISLFYRRGLTYGGKEATLEGLQKIFMADEKTPRGVLVEAIGKISETKSTSANGEEKTYLNTTVFSIEPFNDETKQCSTLSVTGVVDTIKYGEDKDGEPLARIKLGILRYDKDKNISGIDSVTVVAYGEIAEQLEEKDAEKGSVVSLRCFMVNTLGETDIFGDRIGAPKNEIEVKKVVFVNVEDEVDEDDMENYKKAKKLGKGEVLKASVSKDDEDDVVEEPKKAILIDEIESDEIDF